MFKIKADPTFDASITIIGQGREQKLNVTYRHMPLADYLALLEAVSAGEKTVAEAILDVVEKWDADADLTSDTIAILQDQQPGADWAILSSYGDALKVARKGN